MMTVSRRLFIAGLGAVTLLGARPAFAAASTKPKLLLIMLRGGMDGLGAFPKIDDPHIEAHRGVLIPQDRFDIADGFAIHGSLPSLASWYAKGEASIIHALAGPWRERSHFLAQDLLETGMVAVPGDDGWLNRALARDPSLSAVSIGPASPLILAGPAQTSSWSPPVLPEASEETLMRLAALYDNDPMLKMALSQAIETDMVAGDMEMTAKTGNARSRADNAALSGAARLLAAPGGPDVAVVSLGGWDTHSAQNGKLGGRLATLDAALSGARDILGPLWANTTMACVSEFGRTVRANGSGGTDHGTAGAAFLAGGALTGGRVLGDWPGLAPNALYENRDLAAANDMHGLFKGLLAQLYGFERRDLNAVFPETKETKALNLA